MSTVSIPPGEPIWQMSVEKYHKMITAGVLNESDPVELLEGWLIPKMPKNARHCNACDAIVEAFNRMALPGYFVRGQNPITTFDSEPEPDVCVVRGARAEFVDRHPGPDEAALVIEVADTTLSRDRGIKKRIYARADVPVYWIVNLEKWQVEVYSEPFDVAQPDYATVRLYMPGEEIPLMLDGREVARLPVALILGS